MQIISQNRESNRDGRFFGTHCNFCTYLAWDFYVLFADAFQKHEHA